MRLVEVTLEMREDEFVARMWSTSRKPRVSDILPGEDRKNWKLQRLFRGDGAGKVPTVVFELWRKPDVIK